MDNANKMPRVALRVKLEKSQKFYDVTCHYCPNPRCPCNDVTLYFFKADEQLADKLFKIVLNYDTWKIQSTELYSNDDDYPKLIHEFMSEIVNADDVKEYIIDGKKAVSSGHEDVIREDIDYTGLTLSTMVYYSEIYDAGVYGQLVVETDGTNYFVMDHYCINPDCDCNDVVLSYTVIKDSKALDKPVLEIRLNLRSKKHRVLSKSISNQEADDLYSLLLSYVGEQWQSFFKERYIKMKKWGEDFAKRVYAVETTDNMPKIHTGKKVGRNESCPCGSGKKYKRCCGR